jgi:hypothetical protein
MAGMPIGNRFALFCFLASCIVLAARTFDASWWDLIGISIGKGRGISIDIGGGGGDLVIASAAVALAPANAAMFVVRAPGARF